MKQAAGDIWHTWLTRGRGAQVMTPRQYAQALVASYPYLPDALALAGCTAAAEAPSGSPNPNPGTSTDSRASVEQGAAQPGPGIGSPPSSSSAPRADPLLVSAWPGPPPAIHANPDPASEGAEASEGHAGREQSPQPGGAAERALKPSPPSGELQTASGNSLTSAYPKAAARNP